VTTFDLYELWIYGRPETRFGNARKAPTQHLWHQHRNTEEENLSSQPNTELILHDLTLHGADNIDLF
jgi:hypothetical protein